MIAALLVVAALSEAGAKDACQPLVPPDLARTVASAYPGHRLPRGDDQGAYNVGERVKQGGVGCLGVAHGDFNGDKKPDIALLLARGNSTGTLLLVALRQGEGWKLELLDTWELPVASYYVDIVKPGTYEGFYGESPPLPNQVRVIRSAYEGVAAGQLESTTLFYFRSKGKWRFVWISD